MTQETELLTNSYVYDSANRLTSVDGQAYTYDSNGNLLSDGVSTYTYDKANRLTAVSQGGVSYGYAYNGLGDRLQQTIDSVLTNYTLDLNTGLTQVLSDGASTYLYGLGRIGEYDTTWTYHLADALGSVRQIADSNGGVTLTQNYAPYGDVLGSYGESTSNYGYAGEWTDGTGLQHLRARYLNTGIGRFISRDTWAGDYNKPMSLNRWMYAIGNPTMYSDPSGNMPCTSLDPDCFSNEQDDAVTNTEEGPKPVVSIDDPIPLFWQLCMAINSFSPGTTSVTNDSVADITWDESLNIEAGKYGAAFVGSWTSDNKWSVIQAMNAVAQKFLTFLKSNKVYTKYLAFRAVFGYINFEWNPECPDCRSDFQNNNCTGYSGYANKKLNGRDVPCEARGAVTHNAHRIQFASMGSHPIDRRNHVVHELGHAFNSLFYNDDWGPYNSVPEGLVNSLGFRQGPYWTQRRETTEGEVFADMFLGWTFDSWYAINMNQDPTKAMLAEFRVGEKRNEFMSQYMPLWLGVLAP